jgi:antitoxin (DNA-binding transcriptional repressor) of toxin-antitoxin stability system
LVYLVRVIYLPGGLVKFVSVSDLRLKPGQVWKRLDREGEMIITSRGRPIALLTRVNEEDFEKTVITFRRARGLMAMEAMQRASLVAGKDKISDAEIEAEIRAARRSRRR